MTPSIATILAPQLTPTVDEASLALASNANMALYASMIAYTLAMLMFAWHLAARSAQVAATETADREEVLVGSAGTTGAGSSSAGGPVSSAAGLTESGQESEASRQRGNIALMLTYLATALLVGSVVLRGFAVARPPWGNMFEFATASAAAVGLTYSVLAKRNRWQWLGVFIVSPVLLTLGLSLAVLYTEAGELMPALKSYWLAIHVGVAFISVGFFTIAAAIGMVYLVRLRREEKPPAKRSFIESLPSSAALERTAYSLNMVAFILWTFTLIAGSIWAKQAWGAYWQWDPKEVWTFVIWTVYAAYMHGRATAGVDLRRSMYIALVGFVCVIINFTLVNLVSTFVGMHNYSGM
ncbi:c-type cytochrome biogenesis protein CcsB [Intrasporangium calvum]|uniref:C-type cytochrome biogenesis protein CcsB n=1 Tax=Intrasporangium calvum TaxID=53358 RepID=A0ABT5GDV2_9MICO|nr:c-type cytochrome biogenesis protein CcsB [Intrasporangium calvum]MDC5696433.1 c-type cytochrome biogenesis protein CcsB [Intrasporangium calvum]